MPKIDVQTGLARIRQRLLDLTARNKLLSFRHGSTSLRVVDVDLEASFNNLLSEKKLALVAVDKLTHGEESSYAEKPTARQLAEQRGWRTSYDLVSGEGNPDKLRALFYPDDLDAVVRKISTAARTAIEESGTNLLHLVFGFIEWRESEDSSQVRLAPLVAMPVKILLPKIGSTDRAIRLEHTGEDIITNISLVEKMRRDFGLDFPRYEEEDSPEQYFLKLAPILERKQDWRVLRQMSLCLLSFGKLLMYLDLDAARWPQPSMLESHGRLEELFTSRDASGIGIAEEYQIDDEDEKAGVPILVCDADSSQHSALIDAERGRNLVIEGPPGTGKSQTITNLIAGFLSRGKRVLFVAEKMAALEVVKRRMDSYGLGHFCLELHSHKTNKVGLLKSLDDRIQATSTFRWPDSVSHKRGLLKQKVRELSKYTNVLNQPSGEMSLSPFELIWLRDRVRSDLPTNVQETNGITFLNTHTWTLNSLEERRQAIDSFNAHLMRLKNAGGSLKPGENPWQWLPTAELSLEDREALLTQMRHLRDLRQTQLDILEEIETTMSGLCSITPPSWLDQLEAWQDQIPEDISPDSSAILQYLKLPEKADLLQAFAARISQYHQIENLLPGGDALVNKEFASLLTSLLDSLEGCGFERFTLGQLTDIVGTADAVKDRLVSNQRIFKELSTAFRVNLRFTVESTSDLTSAVKLLDNAPAELLDLRSENLGQDGIRNLLRRAKSESESIIAVRDELDSRFILDDLPSESDLQRAAATIEQSTWFSRLFNRDYKLAITLYARLKRSCTKDSPAEMSAGLRKVASFTRKRNEFTTRADVAELASSNFMGIDTPWSSLLELAEWYENVLIALPEHRSGAGDLGRALLTLPAARLKAIRATCEETEAVKEMRGISERIRRIQTIVPHVGAGQEDMERLLQDLERIAGFCKGLLTEVSKLNLATDTTDSVLHQHLFKASSARQLRESIEQDEVCIGMLGDCYRSTHTDIERISEGLRFVRSIHRSALPSDLQDWLLSPLCSTGRSILLDWIKRTKINNAALSEVEQRLQ